MRLAGNKTLDAIKTRCLPSAPYETSNLNLITHNNCIAGLRPGKIRDWSLEKHGAAADLKAMEDRWEAAVGAHDAKTVDGLVAPDFAGVWIDGTSRSKSGILRELKDDRDTYTSTKNEKLDVHSYGPNVAVVIGTAREKGTGKDGKAFDRTYRFTDTWMERSGQWQCV